jgi:DNA-binding GntR family transcriptional regulator
MSGRARQIPVEHARIVDAIASADGREAADAVKAHIATTWRALLGES